MSIFKFKYLISFIITPLLSFILWLFTSRTWVDFIDLLFLISIFLGIIFFVAIVIQEGILDTTSYGFRKFRYQMMRSKTKAHYKEDTFFNPKAPKKEYYAVKPWLKYALIIQLCYLLSSFLLAFIV
ncbi:DUF3899 domain-containing protein [Staphylococcus sp. 11261D007BR]